MFYIKSHYINLGQFSTLIGHVHCFLASIEYFVKRDRVNKACSLTGTDFRFNFNPPERPLMY